MMLKKTLLKNGFTLIELFVTLTILIVLIGAIVYLSPKFIAKQNLKNDAWQLLNDIKEFQERARGQLEFLKMELKGGTNSYRFEKRKNAFSTNNSEEITTRTLSKEVIIKSITISSGGQTQSSPPLETLYLCFDEWGSPKDQNNIPIEGFAVIKLESQTLKDSNGNNYIVEIKITPGTGRGIMDGPKPGP